MALAQVTYFSQSLMRTIPINVLIPTDKRPMPGVPSREKKPFQTLYLLHGIFGSYPDWANNTRILSWAQARNLAVVMPSGENGFYVDDTARGALYGDWIGRELVEFTRDTFPLSDKREDTFLAGLSMGGYGALRNGLKYHDTFGYIGALSAGLILDQALTSTEDAPNLIGKRSYYESVFGDLNKLKGSDMDYKALITSLKEKGAEIPKLYMACGTEDFLIEANHDYRDFLQANGIDFTYEEGPGVHDWVFWDTYIAKFLDWLPLEGKSEGIHSGNVR